MKKPPSFKNLEAISTARQAGLEPTTPGLEGSSHGRPTVHSDSQTPATIQDSAASQVQKSQPFAGSPKDFGAGVVQDTPELVTVREAARLLRVSTATIYKLCADGDLVHIRVSNAIRIPRLALTRVLGP